MTYASARHDLLRVLEQWDRPMPPSIRELTAIVGAKSTSVVSRQLVVLRREGLVTWDEGHKRTLRLTGRQPWRGPVPGSGVPFEACHPTIWRDRGRCVFEFAP